MASVPCSPPPSAVPALIICGMHRSGTSLTAALCQSAGLDIGVQLVPAHVSNQAGHFEDVEFYRFHESVLAANGRIPAGYGIFDAPLVVSDTMRREAEALKAARRSRGHAWGWKDPRTTLFLDFWASVLPEARFLFVFRAPAEVADSLGRRGEERFQDDGEEAFRTWYRYNSLLRDFALAHPDRVLVRELRQIVVDPGRLCADIRRRLDVPLGSPLPLFRPEMLGDGQVTPATPPARGLIGGCARLMDELRVMAGEASSVAGPFRGPVGAGARSVAVVIPVHRLPLTRTEDISLSQVRHHLSCEDRIVVAPASLDTTSLGLPTRPFPDEHFRSVDAYSRLLLSREFYEAFRDYEYILIHQLDCLTFSSDLDHWCRQGWDYAGAPWFPNGAAGPGGGLWAVGNGGLSLRRIPSFLRLLERPEVARAIAVATVPEDMFWSFEARRIDPTFTVPSPREAAAFAIESSPRHCFALNGNALPFGCHYWPHIDANFWRAFLPPDVWSVRGPEVHPLDDMLHPDHRWMRAWVERILGAVVAGESPQGIAELLTFDMSDAALEASPTADGINQVFDRLLGRAAPAAWFEFWVGKPGARLKDIRRDLALGEEFRARCLQLVGAGAEPTARDVASASAWR